MSSPLRMPGRTVFVILVIALTGLVLASDPPDSAVNLRSGNIETADPVWSGSNQNIDFVIKSESGLTVESLTDHSLDDRRPRLTNASSGDAWVTWWRDDTIDKILVRKRNYSDGSWDGERVLSSAGESSRMPAIVHDGDDPWVAYEFDDGTETAIAVAEVIDEPDPVGIRVQLATTSYAGSRDVTIHSEPGHLWVTWVDAADDVGWVEYDYTGESWSAAAYESYAQDTVADARSRIKADVLGD